MITLHTVTYIHTWKCTTVIWSTRAPQYLLNVSWISTLCLNQIASASSFSMSISVLITDVRGIKMPTSYLYSQFSFSDKESLGCHCLQKCHYYLHHFFHFTHFTLLPTWIGISPGMVSKPIMQIQFTAVFIMISELIQNRMCYFMCKLRLLSGFKDQLMAEGILSWHILIIQSLLRPR